MRRVEPEGGAVVSRELVGQRIEREAAGEAEGGDDLGAGDEVHGLGAAVVASREVAVVGGDDGVGGAVEELFAPPLADAGAAGVGEDGGVDSLQGGHLAVALDGGADLLGAGGDHEGRCGGRAARAGLVGNVGGAAHVLVGGVGAAADEGGVDGVDEAVGVVGDLGGEHGYGAGPVGGVGPDDVGLEGREVDLDEAVEVGRGVVGDLGVGRDEGGVGVGEVGEVGAIGGAEVALHALVVWEYGGGRAELGAHVGDGGLAGAAYGGCAGAEVLDDGVGAAGDGELAGEAEDHVLGGGPAAHLAGEPDADVAGVQELPGQAGHDLDGIRAADADGAGAEAAGVGCVGVGADDHGAGEGVVFEHDLVDYAGARAPESRAELRGGGAEEGVDLVVLLDGLDEVDAALDAGLDEVVAVDGGGDGGGVSAGLHEVEHDGLAEDVLECDAVGPERELALALGEVLAGGVVEVAEEELVGEGEGPAEPATDYVEVVRGGGVDAGDHFGGGLDGDHISTSMFVCVGILYRVVCCGSRGGRTRWVRPYQVCPLATWG